MNQQQQQPDPSLEQNENDDTSIKNYFQYQIKNVEAFQQNLLSKDAEGVMTEEEIAIGTDIIMEYKKKQADFERFLEQQYVDFDYKINKCLLNLCYDNIQKPRDDVLKCKRNCYIGIDRADQFVEGLIGNFTGQFSECIEKAQLNKKDIMKESFQCYDIMLNNFLPLKKQIKQEFNYYQ